MKMKALTRRTGYDNMMIGDSRWQNRARKAQVSSFKGSKVPRSSARCSFSTEVRRMEHNAVYTTA